MTLGVLKRHINVIFAWNLWKI